MDCHGREEEAYRRCCRVSSHLPQFSPPTPCQSSPSPRAQSLHHRLTKTFITTPVTHRTEQSSIEAHLINPQGFGLQVRQLFCMACVTVDHSSSCNHQMLKFDWILLRINSCMIMNFTDLATNGDAIN